MFNLENTKSAIFAMFLKLKTEFIVIYVIFALMDLIIIVHGQENVLEKEILYHFIYFF